MGHASADRRKLQAESTQLAADRDDLRRQVTAVNREVARLREIENHVNAPVVPGFTSVLHRGPLTQIVRDVQRLAPTHDWMPEQPDGAPDLPPLDHAAFHELLGLLRLPSSDLEARAGQEMPGPESFRRPARSPIFSTSCTRRRPSSSRIAASSPHSCPDSVPRNSIISRTWVATPAGC